MKRQNEKETLLFYLKRVGQGLLAGFIAGLLLGAGGRIAMRIVALAARRATEFSLEGTLGILLIGAILGLIGGLLFVTVGHFLPFGGVWKGAIFGTLFFLVLIPLLPGAIQEEIAGAGDRLPGIIGLFGAIFLAYGVVLQSTLGRLERSSHGRHAAGALNADRPQFVQLAKKQWFRLSWRHFPGVLLTGILLMTGATRPVWATTTPSGATFLNEDHNTASASIQVDTQGGLHAAYVSDPEAEAYYTYCAPAADCANRANWSAVTIGNNVHEVQLALTPAGRPRLLLQIQDDETSVSGLNSTWWYAECDNDCTSGANWSMIFLGGHADADVDSFATSNHYFALDPQGRPRLVFGPKADFDPDTFETYDYSVYAACDQDCTATAGTDPETGKPIPAHWSFGRILGLFHQPALAFTRSGEPRIAAFSPADDESGQDLVEYLACDAGCDQGTNWTATALSAQGIGNESLVLRLDSQDRPRLVLFFQTDQLSYLWCNGNCGEGANWGSLPLNVGSGDGAGRDGDLQFDGQDRPRIAFQWREDPTQASAQMGLGYLWCDVDCESSTASFSRRLIEESSQLDTDWPLTRPIHCVWGNWLGGYRPALALDSTGNPYIAYDGEFVVGSCLGQPGTTTQTHAGIRFLFFPQNSQTEQHMLFLPLVTR